MIIEVENVSKSYGKIKVLDNISFGIEENKTTCLIGPNGAGKTTTLRILSGLLKPDTGKVYIKNIDLFEEPEKAKKYVGYLPEDPIPFINLSVRENLEYIGLLRNVKDLYNKIDFYLDYFDLKKYENYRAINLSRGNRQKLALSMVLLFDPEILLLDEPLNYLDIESQHKIIELLKNIKNTKLISTHIISIAEKLGDNIIIINKGKILYNDNIRKLEENGKLEENILKLLK
ncbi:multidrug ABC transporter ATP-binding protein [Nanoarchaeota archaeon]